MRSNLQISIYLHFEDEHEKERRRGIISALRMGTGLFLGTAFSPATTTAPWCKSPNVIYAAVRKVQYSTTWIIWCDGHFLELVIETSLKSVQRQASTAQRNNGTVVISWSFGRLTTTVAGYRTRRCSFSIRTRCNICKRASNCVNNIQKCVPEKKKKAVKVSPSPHCTWELRSLPSQRFQCFCRNCVLQPVWRVWSHTFYILDWLDENTPLWNCLK